MSIVMDTSSTQRGIKLSYITEHKKLVEFRFVYCLTLLERFSALCCAHPNFLIPVSQAVLSFAFL